MHEVIVAVNLEGTRRLSAGIDDRLEDRLPCNLLKNMKSKTTNLYKRVESKEGAKT